MAQFKSFPKDMKEWQAAENTYNDRLDMADAPLFVQPSELRSAEIVDGEILTPTVRSQQEQMGMPAINKSNFMQPAMEEAEEQNGMQPLEQPSELAAFKGVPEDNSKPNNAPTLSKREQMLQEYMQLAGKDREELAAARKKDRWLKMGGAIGDALTTIVNAQGQKNVKAPGVQVQQGAGLGKIADMFQTSGDVKDDIKSRREDLLAQYKAMAESGTGQASPNAWQIVAEVKDGKQQLKRINKITGEEFPVGEKATYRQFRTDPGSGNLVALDQLSGKSLGVTGSDAQNEEPQNTAPVTLEEQTQQTFNSFNPVQKKLLEKARADYNKATKDSVDKVTATTEAASMLDLAERNPAAAAAYGTNIAQMFQPGGRLSDKDVDLYIRNPALKARIRQTWFDLSRGTLDPARIPEFKQVLQEVQKSVDSDLSNKAEIFGEQRLSTIGVPKEVAAKLMNPRYQAKDPKIKRFADKNTGGDYEKAIAILKKRGDI